MHKIGYYEYFQIIFVQKDWKNSKCIKLAILNYYISQICTQVTHVTISYAKKNETATWPHVYQMGPPIMGGIQYDGGIPIT